MVPGFVGRWFGRWAEPIGGLQGPVAMVLKVLAIALRLYAGYKFVQYGYDKLLGGDQIYGLSADFFKGIGIPLPEVNHLLIGLLELFGGLALIVGLLTRVFGFLLACNMLVAMITAGNTAEELPLFICSALLILLGGGFLSVDQLIDRWLAGRGSPASLSGSTARRGL